MYSPIIIVGKGLHVFQLHVYLQASFQEATNMLSYETDFDSNSNVHITVKAHSLQLMYNCNIRV